MFGDKLDYYLQYKCTNLFKSNCRNILQRIKDHQSRSAKVVSMTTDFFFRLDHVIYGWGLGLLTRLFMLPNERPDERRDENRYAGR